MTQMNGEEQVRGMSRAVLLVLRYRAVTLILFLVITGLLCRQLGNIGITKDPSASMVPPGHSFSPVLQAIEEMSTQPETLVGILEVKNGDVYNKETVKKVERITRRLMSMEEIIPGKIISLATGLNHYENTVEGLMGEPILGRIPPETEEDFQAVKRRVAVNPLGIGSFVSYDGTATMITASIVDLDTKTDVTYGQLPDAERAALPIDEYKERRIDGFHQNLLRVVGELKRKEEDENHILHFTGDRLLAAQMTSMGRTQVPVAAAAMLALVVVVLAGYFRSFQGTLVPVFAFAFSVLWGLGLFGAGNLSLNPMAFLFPLMLGVLSLVCGALVMDAYDRTRGGAESKMQAIAASYRSAPVAASVLTAGLVSLTLLVAGVPMIRELGWLGLFWAAGTLVVVVLVCPVVMSVIPRPAGADSERRGGVYRSLAEGLAKPSRGSGKVVMLIFLALILAAGGLLAWRLDVGDNFPGSSYVRSGHPWNRGFRVMAERFNGPYTLLVHVRAKEEGGLLHPEAINQMGDFSTYLKGEVGARESVAFDWVVKLGRISLLDGNPKWWTVPASKEDMEGLSRLLTFSGELEVLVDQPFTQATIASVFPEKEAEYIDAYVSKMQAYIDSHPSDYIEFSLAGGLLGKTKAINDGTRDAYTKTMALALVTVFVVGIFVSRSVVLSLVVTLAVAAGQALALWIMAILGWPVSLAAVPAAVVSVGFGAVLGTYLVRRFGEAGGQSVDSGDGLVSTWGRAGGGVIFFGALAFAGMLPWFFIGLKFQADMALVLGITVMAQAIAVATFIPSLTAAFQK